MLGGAHGWAQMPFHSPQTLLPGNLMLCQALSITYCGDCQIPVPSPKLSGVPSWTPRRHLKHLRAKTKRFIQSPHLLLHSLLFLSKWPLHPQLLKLRSEIILFP